MPVIEGHAPGAPCWFELGTTDQNAAKQFYAQMFGWSVNDHPMGENEFYTLFQINGHDAASAYTLMPNLIAQGIPPHWMVYFATPDVEESVRKVVAGGGSVKQPPMDIWELGRLAVCQDPTGAVFSLWQAKQHKGATIVGETNAICWSELATRDVPKAREFYTSVFDWQTKPSAGFETYIEFYVAGQPRGGLMPMDEQWANIPPHWGIYVQVNDADAVVEKIKEMGGSVKYGPFDAPGVGRMAAVSDPQGAVFSVIKLQMA